MAKVTWLGEDELHGNGAGPSFTTWAGLKFPKGEAVDVTNPDMLRRAKGNRFFRVQEEAAANPPDLVLRRGPGRPPKVKPDGD